MNHDIRKFILRTLLALTPLIAFVALYVVKDPLGAFSTMPDQAIDDNLLHTSWLTYNNLPDSVHFDSYILGSSVALYLRTADWEKHLPEGARATHIISAGAHIDEISATLQALISQKTDIKRCLILINQDAVYQDHRESRSLYTVIPPQQSPNIATAIKFHMMYFKAFRQQVYLKQFFGKKKKTKKRIGLSTTPYDPLTHEPFTEPVDSLRIADPEAYYNRFFKDTDRYVGRRIFAVDKPISMRGIENMKALRDLLHKHSIDYHIVVFPKYKSEAINSYTSQCLYEIFGDRLHDFTGRKDISHEWNNYYDVGHLNNAACAAIIDECLQPQMPQANFFTSATKSSSLKSHGSQ